MRIQAKASSYCICKICKHLSIGKESHRRRIYYYEIKTEEKPNLENTEYTENEKDGNFELRYIPLTSVEEELSKNAKEYGDKKGIAREMIELFDIYKATIN